MKEYLITHPIVKKTNFDQLFVIDYPPILIQYFYHNLIIEHLINFPLAANQNFDLNPRIIVHLINFHSKRTYLIRIVLNIIVQLHQDNL